MEKKSVNIHYILMLEYSYSGNIHYRVDTQLYIFHGAVMAAIKRISQVIAEKLSEFFVCLCCL